MELNKILYRGTKIDSNLTLVDMFSKYCLIVPEQCHEVQSDSEYCISGTFHEICTLQNQCGVNNLWYDRLSKTTIMISGKAFFKLFDSYLSNKIFLSGTAEALFIKDNRIQVEDTALLHVLALDSISKELLKPEPKRSFFSRLLPQRS